jgi:hypothetical protein
VLSESLSTAFYLIYKQTCIKRSPLGQRKSGLLRKVNSEKRFNSDEFFKTEEEKGDLLIQVTA